jgi:hypothetical protein
MKESNFLVLEIQKLRIINFSSKQINTTNFYFHLSPNIHAYTKLIFESTSG